MRQIAIPDDLAREVEAKGNELSDFAILAIRHELARQIPVEGQTFGEILAKGYQWPTFEGSVRPDGIPWSEIEAPCDPA